MTGDQQALRVAQINSDETLSDWRLILGRLRARFATGSFASGVELVNAIGEVSQEVDHYPEVDLRTWHVDVKLISHDLSAVTPRDVRLARRISQRAAQLGAEARPREVQSLEIALDTPNYQGIKPFWRTVLGLADHPKIDKDLEDPAASLPDLWFQRTEDTDPSRMRFHLDIAVPPDVATERVAAAVEAGGTLVDDRFAPAFWVLADAEGNKVCVCTCEGREDD
ncbi:VOC family protein [Natronoglycomyces albus]|uniref:Putative pterin-4-alpha-carbinolamine dehydratase n=1 Tax=Natronoglycomyces albus TaxID=2811108 RepID=A0A895XTQ2_9ACTN|nr:VOC family protein [Natronoglycomyces albus]QSB05630.1 4a-hydroxytetrahydrobiopterin dehydratase [Natronoglycomyces albus]